jgi:hypothetical protein
MSRRVGSILLIFLKIAIALRKNPSVEYDSAIRA